MAADASMRPGRGRGPVAHPAQGLAIGGARRALLIGMLLAGAWSFAALDLQLYDLWPGRGGIEVARAFFSRALSPALVSEAQFVPSGTAPLLIGALAAALRTLVFAAAALGLALLLGLGLGFLASSAWWTGAGSEMEWTASAWLKRGPAPAVYLATRIFIAFLRSIHELIWAVLFLAGLGLSELAAVLAIALPYAGVLAKVFSEIVDEAPRDAAAALRSAGASRIQVFLFALLPQALPDMLAYTFYRLECAVRSSTILGFFGFPTLGLYIRQSFNSTSYGEVWTYLYVLVAMVVVLDGWSGAVRRRLIT